ncbi:MAG: hypothetical protein LBL66_11180 [Clostridiales bacterium]|nr:hypothetical protein [Clostridiales bacterium]
MREESARGVPLFGRDCRVAFRAPRNDKRFRFFTANRMTRANFLDRH